MNRVIFEDDMKVPAKIWTNDIDDNTIEQVKNLGKLPFLFKHLAIMPDCHWGMGSTVGSVIATQGAIIPAAVGVDIGCGMRAVKLPFKRDALPEDMRPVRRALETMIPTGFNCHTQLTDRINSVCDELLKDTDYGQKLNSKVRHQLGTLGGGNHFIEICVDLDDYVWIMLHSGSRYIGKTLADKHMRAAKNLMEKFYVNLPDPHLAFLPKGTPEFDAYMRDLMFCQRYAKANRKEMMERAKTVINTFVDGLNLPEFDVDCHHNYADIENHFGQNVIVVRKGAVRARKGDIGIIPGSMGAKSFIVKGLGNPESFESCSHGAGRKMSRRQAKEQFTKEDLEKATEGVECRTDVNVLDEIPGAYKDIDTVIANQTDLVEPIYQLKQILCVKG